MYSFTTEEYYAICIFACILYSIYFIFKNYSCINFFIATCHKRMIRNLHKRIDCAVNFSLLRYRGSPNHWTKSIISSFLRVQTFISSHFRESVVCCCVPLFPRFLLSPLAVLFSPKSLSLSGSSSSLEKENRESA